MKRNVWLLTFSEFDNSTKTINSKQYADDYFRLGKKHCVGCHYYLYVSTDLEIINPYTKKDRTKKVMKSFCSTFSALEVKQMAYKYILQTAIDNGILDESIYDRDLIEKQKQQLQELSKTL